MSTPTIEVFLMFKPGERNSYTKRGKMTIEKGPDWQSIDGHLRKDGYTLIVHGPSSHPSVKDIQDSMSNAEVTLLVGHGASTGAAGVKWISDQIELADGMIRSPDGVLVGKWNKSGGLDKLDNPTIVGKLKINKVTGVFTCNSTDKLPGAFDLRPGRHLVTNDGGKDGLTRIGTLELGAATFVKWYGQTKGDVGTSMLHAQFQFKKEGQRFGSDRGDRLSDKVGVTPRAEVKDWFR